MSADLEFEEQVAEATTEDPPATTAQDAVDPLDVAFDYLVRATRKLDLNKNPGVGQLLEMSRSWSAFVQALEARNFRRVMLAATAATGSDQRPSGLVVPS